MLMRIVKFSNFLGSNSINWLPEKILHFSFNVTSVSICFTPLCCNPIRLLSINISRHDRLSRSQTFSEKKKLMIGFARFPLLYFSNCPTIDSTPECNSIFKTLPFRVIVAPFMCSGYVFKHQTSHYFLLSNIQNFAKNSFIK